MSEDPVRSRFPRKLESESRQQRAQVIETHVSRVVSDPFKQLLAAAHHDENSRGV